jgi:hypothetical protein
MRLYAHILGVCQLAIMRAILPLLAISIWFMAHYDEELAL